MGGASAARSKHRAETRALVEAVVGRQPCVFNTVEVREGHTRGYPFGVGGVEAFGTGPVDIQTREARCVLERNGQATIGRFF